MHRDVTLKNMFVLSLKPARAVLGDFGKAVRAQTDQDISIGPAATRAPEVDGKTPYCTSWHGKLAELLVAMLALDPVERVSAAQAWTQVAALLAFPPLEQVSPTVLSPQNLDSKPSGPVSDLSQRDAQIKPGWHPFTFENQVQEEPVGASGKKVRLQ